MTEMYRIRTPIGVLEANISNKGLSSISLLKEEHGEDFSGLYDRNGGDLLAALKTYMTDFFYGREVGRNDIPLDMSSISPFRKRIYEELMKVSFGDVITYGDLAVNAGCPGGARAVGNAMNSNPFLIVVPCHRVVASSGRGKLALGGFGAGTNVKRFLLTLEGHTDDIIGL